MEKQKRPEPRHNPMVAQMCRWYPRADENEQPRAAIVTGPHPPSKRGMLDLAVIDMSTGKFEPMANVRHIDDPHLEEHPKIAAEKGGWTHAPADGAGMLPKAMETALAPMLARLVPSLVDQHLATSRKDGK